MNEHGERIQKCNMRIVKAAHKLQEEYRKLAAAHLKLERDSYAISALEKADKIGQILRGEM